MENTIISMWSSPRNVSTALMYSFAQRSDTKVIDEPFYGCYLQSSGADHPGKELVLNSLPTKEEEVLDKIIYHDYQTSLVFLKNMAHHLLHLKSDFLSNFENIFLIRDPRQMLPSFIKVVPNPTMTDVAYKMQFELIEKLSVNNKAPTIIDSKNLLIDPEKVLKILCDQLNISFEPAMLSWLQGGISEDGVWAPFWYSSVHRSTGFMPFKESNESVPKHLKDLMQECIYYYDKMKVYAIRPDQFNSLNI